MNMSETSQQPGNRNINWPVIGGLSALALLWPLAELTGMPAGGPRALVLLAIMGVYWIGVVGVGRFPRPVLTLTLVGLATGILWQVFGLVIGEALPAPVWAKVIGIGMQGIWGACAGLIALGLQSVLGKGEGEGR